MKEKFLQEKKEFKALGIILLALLLVFLPEPVFSLSTAIALPLALVAIFLFALGFSLLKEFFLESGKQK